MCLTPEALALFLNMLDPAVIDTEAERIIIRAERQETVWEMVGDLWCTDARHPERLVEMN